MSETELNEPSGHSNAPDRVLYSSMAAVGANVQMIDVMCYKSANQLS